MRARVVMAGVVLVGLLAGITLLLSVVGGAEGQAEPEVTAKDPGPRHTPNGQFRFVSGCGFSHRAPDDPIVGPGKPGTSHMHDFFGNRSTDAHSTLASLRSDRRTSCRFRPAATSAYWAPSLYKDGKPVDPRLALIYYYGAGARLAGERIRAHPPGLRMIAGDPEATEPQDARIVHWDCGADSRVTYRAEVPLCRPGYGVRLLVRFPDCWDGKQLDTPDHRSHVAYYDARQGCPGSHPVLMPQIILKISYKPFRGGPGVRLASGSRFSGHADFFSAWDQDVVDALVERCINRGPVAPNDKPCEKPGAPPAVRVGSRRTGQGDPRTTVLDCGTAPSPRTPDSPRSPAGKEPGAHRCDY